MKSDDPVWFIVSTFNGVEYPGVVTDSVSIRALKSEFVIGKLRIDTRPDFAELSALPLSELHKRLKTQIQPVDNRKKQK
jgi:hypothetical protein